MSFEEMRQGKDQPLMAEQTRTRIEHINGIRERYDTDAVSKNFVEDSIRGMGDTNTQQLSQPIVGDMSRIARIAASCVKQEADGTVGICTETSFMAMCKFDFDTKAGNTALRGISVICAAFQQVKLDSHHAKKRAMASHDLISDMIVGSKLTLVLFDRSFLGQIRKIVKPAWMNVLDNVIYALCDPTCLETVPSIYVTGTYNPIALKSIPIEKRIDVCHKAISAVIRYYSLGVSEIEISFLSVLFAFKPEKSIRPVTTREGIKVRDLRWTETSMATHYAGLTQRMKKGPIEISPIDTVSSCLIGANFRYLQ